MVMRNAQASKSKKLFTTTSRTTVRDVVVSFGNNSLIVGWPVGRDVVIVDDVLRKLLECGDDAFGGERGYG